jgi:L,D-transpeptidase ErfK/SrfK
MRTRILSLALTFVIATAADAQTLSGQVHLVPVARGDTLRAIGARFGAEAAAIARDNGRPLDAAITAGETLRVDNRHIVPPFPDEAAVVINVPQRMLFATSASGLVAYPAAVGRAGWPTPLGDFSVASKETNPTWDVPASIREEARRAGRSLPLKVPPGPNNPLGAHWLGLSGGGVGIHGTNAPRSIYQAVTHGCIRLHPDDIAALFRQVRIGTSVRVLYQPILVAVAGDDVYVEAHRDVYRRAPRDPLEVVKARASELGVFDRIDWQFTARVLDERAGVARLVSR